MRTALITGISGQDGSYLSELLLSKGYEVHGTVRRASAERATRVDISTGAAIHLHYADLTDSASLREVLERVSPDEIYNLAAQSHVRVSFERPVETVEINGLGALRWLEVVRASGSRQTRFFQASSSEIFGNADESPQSEATPVRPLSPYASGKALAFHSVKNYRDAFGIFASNGILFNHESPRRGEAFVTRKITRAAARIKLGLARELPLGNLEGRRDWGHARDYVEAMWRILQADAPDDYVIATGETRSVRDFLEEAFKHVALDWRDFVKVAEQELRPVEVKQVVGDASHLRRTLGWAPRTPFAELVKEMVEHDLELARRELSEAAKG
jgi:GDPmannose 4,6-dehydratase